MEQRRDEIPSDSAEASLLPHADYPHTPGALYDCLACESECFCMDDFECLFCSLTEEADCV